MRKYILFLLSLFLFAVFWACQSTNKNGNEMDNQTQGDNTGMSEVNSGADLSPTEAQAFIADRADAALQAIATKSYDELSTYVHPTQGLRFSPYPNIDTTKDVVLSRQEVADLPSSEVRLWGYADGSGKPIESSFEHYYKDYIYDKPYNSADTIGYNETISRSNVRYNYREIYPNSILVEYYIPGNNPKYDNMDWGSIMLIFTPYEGKWYLTDVAHGEWTI